MYETEVNDIHASCEEIPPQILARFAETRDIVSERTLIPWSEHCTECVWPSCYTTCDLYAPRRDGRCRRFVEGMVRVSYPPSLNSYILKVSFKRWAKLWAVANLDLRCLAEADRAETRDLRVGTIINIVPWPALQRAVSLKRYSLKKRRMRRGRLALRSPTFFMLECYNPNEQSLGVTLTVRRENEPNQFQALLTIAPGFNRHSVPVNDIRRSVDVSAPFLIDLTPNEIPDGLTLFFGAMDFVAGPGVEMPLPPAAPSDSAESRICKCVVFDLDNTLWDGTIMEDGAETIRLRPRIRDVLSQLDERGILMSIASKNNPQEAMDVLRRLELDEFFLFPQISWGPKSHALHEIARQLNIGMNALLFVDDSRFEREEVKAGCSDVMILDASEYASILERPDCRLPITDDSRRRRQFYRQQTVRDEAQQRSNVDHLTFLRSCNFRMTITPLTELNLERVHELTQRTNQMNFSGNRYSRPQLQNILKNDELDTYVLDCEDRFGSYGTVGFGLVNRTEPRMVDLMFSCRIQAKRVEHAFVSYLVSKYREGRNRPFFVDYRQTKKNAEAGRVFQDLGAQLVAEADGVSKLVFPSDHVVGDDGIVTIVDPSGLRAEVCEYHV